MYSPLEQFVVYKVSSIPGISNSTLTLLGVGLLFFSVTTLFLKRPWSLWMNVVIQLHNEMLKMTQDHLGRKPKYFPLVWSLFNFIGLSNALGLTPSVYTPTTQIIITLGLSTSIWMGVVLIGIKTHGASYIGGFLPGGTPMLLATLMVPIELLSFIAKGVSLGLRLCINVTTGHLLQIIIGEFSQRLLKEGFRRGSLTWTLGALSPIGFIWGLMHLEIGIMLMQAYVFTTLTLIYISESEHIH